MRELLFYHFRPPILALKVNQQIMFFQTRFLDLIFLICLRLFKCSQFWDRFKIQWAPEWHHKSSKCSQYVIISWKMVSLFGALAVPLVLSCFQKVIFSRVGWLMFCFCLVFLCAMFYKICLFPNSVFSTEGF